MTDGLTMEKVTTTSATALTDAEMSATVTAAAAQTSSRQSKAARQQQLARKAVEVAKKQLGDPYRWGASGPGAFDCSGLVQYAWRKAGVDIPRTTWSQRSGVKKKVAWSKLKPGDLIFTSGGGHVGMYVGKGKMIHSPHTGAVVRIDKLDAYRKSSFVGAVRPGS
ncbi:C40 family peptidase [Microtetraspora malaysiensis]|uniref:C40 family peptidase n=1 Tax=Microtetraspora malaysiensis TaxID=161358 RepID=UPI001FDF8EFD|nr:C40 family peptidase [Microtetraspora malaysiensis]